MQHKVLPPCSPHRVGTRIREGCLFFEKRHPSLTPSQRKFFIASEQLEELLAIAKLQAGGKGYTLDERCDANLLAYFNAVQLTRARDAGNGRLARNKVEEAILNQSRRLVAQPEADLCLLLPEDFQLDDVGGV